MRKRITALFLCLVMLLTMVPVTALAEPGTEPSGAGPELDISNGSILITETGYAQGELRFTDGVGFSVVEEVDGESSPVTETPWSGSHELTVTGTNEALTAPAVVVSGSPVITLQNVTASATAVNTPAIVLLSGTDNDANQATATLNLVGENELTGGAGAPAVQINKYAKLTIAGSGKLTAAAGVGAIGGIGGCNSNIYAINPNNGNKDNNFQYDGELVINSGTVVSIGNNTSAKLNIAGLGDYNFGKITIEGGDVTARNPSGQYAIRTKHLVINGGVLRLEPISGKVGNIWLKQHGSFQMTGGTVTAVSCSSQLAKDKDPVTVSITGGNINDSYTAGVAGRVLTKLYFADSSGAPLANTEVSVTEGDNTWTALTNADGMVTTYLTDATASISATVGGATYDTVPVDRTWHTAIVGSACICADHANNAPVMTTKSQSITTANGKATLSLAATYTPTGCNVPAGFHGDYEVIHFEVTKVLKNGQFLQQDAYAQIDGNTLTVFAENNEDQYEVYVSAVCGPDSDKRYSEPIIVTVNTYTYTPVEEEGVLDIGKGSILITDTGYTQGVLTYTNKNKEGYSILGENGAPIPETAWPDASHELTITGTSMSVNANTPINLIMIKGGNPTVTLKNVTIGLGGFDGASTASNVRPAIVLLSGKDNDANQATATLNLVGANKLTGGNEAPAVQINKNAKLTITGSGTLTAAASSGNKPGIGCGSSKDYAINPNNGKKDNNFRYDGELVINSGTVVSTGKSLRASNNVPGLGDYSFGKITIEGGDLTARNHDGNHAIRTKQLVINGGVVRLEPISGTVGNIVLPDNGSFQMTGGTLTARSYNDGKLLVPQSATSTFSVSITGGNINDSYTVGVAGRVLTKLYFVQDENGTPLANTEVSVTEGANTWKALTNADGMVTTYLADTTTSITVEVRGTTYDNVSVRNGQALIGGTCTCTAVSSVTWEPGINETVTLYQDTTYTLAAPAVVAEGGCKMPIHPNLPVITFSLSVKDSSGSAVDASAVANYAAFANNVLTLKKAADPNTVTLTAAAGDKQAVCTVNVTPGAADQVIDLSRESPKELNGDITAAVTGNAAAGTVTVNAGTAELTLDQAVANDDWRIFAAAGADAVKLNARSVSGKVRFGTADDAQARLSYITSGKLKLNPDSGDITFNADGSVTQGQFTVSGLELDKQKIVVMGADVDAARTVTNNSGKAVTLDINRETVTLADGDSFTIKKADNSKQSTAGNAATYLLPDGESYCLIVVGEGDVDVGEFSYAEQSRISRAELDADFTGKLYAGSILHYANVAELHAEQFSAINTYSCGLGELYLGENLSSITGNRFVSISAFHLPESNPYFAVDDGVLYTKDFMTLLVLPSSRTKSYTVRDECTTIAHSALMGSNVEVLTLGKNFKEELSSIPFEGNHISEFRVAEGNPYFAARDGLLYSKDMTRLIAYPHGKTDTTLVIPGSVTYVTRYFLCSTLVEKLIIEEGEPITGDVNSFNAYYGTSALKEVVLKTECYSNFNYLPNLEKVTVPEVYDFTRGMGAGSMTWFKNNVQINGASNVPYDGKNHCITVICTAADTTVEYSLDGETWSSSVECVEPGSYTVYWRITKAADAEYNFARYLMGSRTVTINLVEAAADWFNLTMSRKVGDPDLNTSPVTLSAPVGVPSLENGYTVKYSKDGTATATETLPTSEGNYLVTVDITATGYVTQKLTLGYYSILPQDSTADFVLAFVTNSGSPLTPKLVSAGTSVNEAEVEATTRAGYQFAGWYTDTYLRNKASFPMTINENTVLYAKWTRLTYTVSYAGLDDAVLVVPNPDSYTVESESFTLHNPTKPGYVFTGWTYDGQTTPQREVTIRSGSTGNKSFTANWEEATYCISYQENYTNYLSDAVRNSLAGAYAITDTVTLSRPDKQREGYSFAGWTIKNDGNTNILDKSSNTLSAGTYGDLEIGAIWIADGQVLTFKAEGGKFDNGTDTYLVSADYDSSYSLPNEPTREGYEFAGWFIDQDCTTPFDAPEKMPLSATIYAKWNEVYTLSYELKGGTAENPVSFTVATETFTLNNPTLAGYQFVGWRLNDSEAAAETVTIEKGSTGDRTYTAVWTYEDSAMGVIGTNTEWPIIVDDLPTFTYSIPAADLQSVTVNGRMLTEGKDYTVSGTDGAVITLSKLFAWNLTVGKYTISATFRAPVMDTDAVISTEFTRIRYSSSGGSSGGSTDGSSGGSSSSGSSANALMVTSGDRSVFYTGAAKDLTFTVKGGGTLNKLSIGYAPVDAKDYTVDGNTVTVKASYLSTLGTGTYRISLQFSNGTADGWFTVAAGMPAVTPDPVNPDSVDDTNNAEDKTPDNETDGDNAPVEPDQTPGDTDTDVPADNNVGTSPVLWIVLAAAALLGALVFMFIKKGGKRVK